MKIGIIGAGMIGSTLTRRLTALGHDVRVANSRSPDTLEELAEETGATPVWAEDAVDDVELVVVTIPEKAVTELPDDLFADVPDDVVVVDTGNYYPRERDGRIEPIEEGLPESRWVERQIGRSVVKAFNNIYFESLMKKGRPADSPDRIALPVAGDNDRAKAAVLELIEELGFDGIDAGGLVKSWRQQPGTPVYTTDLDAEGVRQGLKEATPERPPEFRATDNSPGTFEEPA